MEQNNEVLSENSTEEPNSDGQIITSNHSIRAFPKNCVTAYNPLTGE